MNQSFITSPTRYIKRGMKTVRSRALEFIETLQIRQIKELPLPEAREFFSQVLDIWDRATIKAYFGNHAHRQTWINQQRKQYMTGTISVCNIEVSHEVKTSKGYLEKLGLVHYEKRGKAFFMVVENCPILPELVKTEARTNGNFSLSPITMGSVERSEENHAQPSVRHVVPHGCLDGNIETEKRERVQSGRERNRSTDQNNQKTIEKVKVNENSENTGILEHTPSISERHALVKGACDIFNGES